MSRQSDGLIDFKPADQLGVLIRQAADLKNVLLLLI